MFSVLGKEMNPHNYFVDKEESISLYLKDDLRIIKTYKQIMDILLDIISNIQHYISEENNGRQKSSDVVTFCIGSFFLLLINMLSIQAF